MKMIGKFVKKAVTIVAGAAIALSAPLAVASADTGGGLGGGGGGGTVTSGMYWTSYGYNTKGKAYDKFLAAQMSKGRSQKTIEKQINSRIPKSDKGSSGVAICKKSDVIWYVSSSAGKWIWNVSDASTHGPKWDNSSINKYNSTIEKVHKPKGRVATDYEVAAFKNWDKNKNGHKINANPGYVIICSGALDIDQPDKTTPNVKKPDPKTGKPKIDITQDKEAVTYTEPYSYSTEIKRQALKGDNGVDSIGKNNLHNQKAVIKKTNYATLWDSISAGKSTTMTPAQLTSKVNAALKKDKSITHATATLDAKNKAGMAEGGVLNFYEQTRKAKVSASRTVTTEKWQLCTRVIKWNKKTQKYDAPIYKDCVNKSKKSNSPTTVTKVNGTLKNTGFWQMLSVHCNLTDFNALTKADSSLKVLEKGNNSKGIAAVLTTKKYGSQPDAKNIDLGNASNANSAKKKTGSLGFYDKECPFDCTPSASTADGASSKNGATKNASTVKGVSTVKGGKTGAVSGKTNNNLFQFFRDNEAKRVTVDVWYPKTNSTVSYKGAAPLSTTVTRWDKGTPSVTGTDGGKFTMKTADGKTTLFTGKDTATNQKNWEPGIAYSNTNSTLMKGLVNKFDVQATWASDAKLPQVLNVKYEYAPNVTTAFYGTNIGFGKGGAQSLGSTVTASAAIEGKCYVNYGTTKQADTTTVFHDNTGTGTTNNLDKKLLESAGTGDNASTYKSNLVFKFVRATTE